MIGDRGGCTAAISNVWRPLAKKVLTSLKAVRGEAQRCGRVAHNAAMGIKIEIAKRHQRRLEVGAMCRRMKRCDLILDHVKGRWHPLLVTASLRSPLILNRSEAQSVDVLHASSALEPAAFLVVLSADIYKRLERIGSMNSIIYLVGLVVVILAVLSFVGLR